MRIVLTKTAIGISIALLINLIAYAMQNNIGRHSILFYSKISILFVLPTILGYVLSNLAIGSKNWFLNFAAMALLALNTIILTFASFFILGFGISDPILFLDLSYLAVSYYISYHTIIDTKPQKEIMDFQEDILDDNL